MRVRTATCAGARAAKVTAAGIRCRKNANCFLDAVDSQSRALIAQLMGDIITLGSTVTEEYQADYEI